MSKQNSLSCEARPGSRVKYSGLAQTSHLTASSFAPALRVGRGCAEILASRLPPISSRCCPIAAGRRTLRDSTAVHAPEDFVPTKPEHLRKDAPIRGRYFANK